MDEQSDQSQGVCKPIPSLSGLADFLKNPPFWSTLVVPKARRSHVTKNSDLYDNGNLCHLPKPNKLETPLPLRYEYGFLPKTLVCHDMMNGYHDDSHIGGTDNFAAYTFYNWAGVDIFVYFSHHFITIPPLGWINAAHKHGVQILGTIITEWNDGIKICEEFLQSEESMQTFIRNLVTVAKLLNLDGWLLNIENRVEKVDMMMQFVRQLTESMHSAVADSVVIWYDSVTNKGDLKWQNCLNNMNREFFEACDGIFTNYCWAETELQRNVAEAGRRRTDVYVGVDVWGRNFWGGGCLNTVEAVKIIHKYGLSMAIFAPAWTHEAIQFKDLMEQQYVVEQFERDNSCVSKLNKELDEESSKTLKSNFFMRCAVKDHFILRETALWNTIWPYLNTRGPSQLPFQTFFCLGSGNKKRVDGEVTQEKLWFNLNEQEYQLSIPFCSNSFLLEREGAQQEKPAKEVLNTEKTNADVISNELHQDAPDSTQNKAANPEAAPKIGKPPIVKYNVKPNTLEAKCVVPHVAESYKGGSCLKILPVTDESLTNNIVRLFLCEFLCDHNFIMYYIVKSEHQGQDLNLYVTLKDNRTGKPFQVVLCSVTENGKYPLDVATINPLRQTERDKFRSLQMDLVSNHPNFYIPVNNDKSWKIRYFVLEYPNSTILEINCGLTRTTGSVLLGGLGVIRDIPL